MTMRRKPRCRAMHRATQSRIAPVYLGRTPIVRGALALPLSSSATLRKGQPQYLQELLHGPGWLRVGYERAITY